MKKFVGVVAAMAVMSLATAAHAAVAAGVHATLALAGPPPAPEPGTLAIVGMGALLLLRRKRC